jgi:hypothetical protein
MKRGITSLLKSTAGLAALGLYAFGASSAHAQDQQDENAKPKPAAHAPMIDNGDQNTQTVDPDALHPDTTPLTGVLTPGIGTVEFRHSYFVPGVEVATTAQTGGAGNGWFDTTYLAGNASLVESWAHSHFALNYSGGGYFSTDSTQGNGAYQQLAAGQTFEWRRFRLDVPARVPVWLRRFVESGNARSGGLSIARPQQYQRRLRAQSDDFQQQRAAL